MKSLVNLQETKFHTEIYETQFGKISFGFRASDDEPGIYFKSSAQVGSFTEGRIGLPELDIYSDHEVDNINQIVTSVLDLAAKNGITDGRIIQAEIIDWLNEFYQVNVDDLNILQKEN